MTNQVEMDLSRCEGKPAFKSYPEAEHVARGIRKARGWAIGPYYCETCQKYHNGEPKKKPKKQTKRNKHISFKNWSRYEEEDDYDY